MCNGTVISRLHAGSGWYRHVSPYAEPAMANRRQRGVRLSNTQLPADCLSSFSQSLPVLNHIHCKRLQPPITYIPDHYLHGPERVPTSLR